MSKDIELGMDRPIGRRDFINGVSVAIGGLASGAPAFAHNVGPREEAYPPRKTGMRGSHEGSFEYAHALRDGTLRLDAAVDTREVYDLVIVGGGLSGLSAAHLFLKSVGPGAKILILDNHDDFGGHATRNEFMVDGKLLAINGGTLYIEAPERYNQWPQQLFDDLGIDLERFRVDNKANEKLYASLGLRGGLFFDRETWKVDQLAVNNGSRPGFAAFADAALPLSAAARADLVRLYAEDQPDYLPGKTVKEKIAYLAGTSLEDYYLKTVRIDPQVMWYFRNSGAASFCVGADAMPALFGWVQDMPGFSGLGLGSVPDGLFADLPGGQHGRQKEGGKHVHFPDGNATISRMLVARLVPAATKARTQEEMSTAQFDYGQLDLTGQPTRIRLASTVVNVRHDGDPRTATEAVVRYMNKGRLQSVRGKSVILASWNMMIPYIMPELPAAQREALAYGVKGPLVYTSVALRNWKAFERLGVHIIDCPTMFHQRVSLNEAASVGALRQPASPDEPITVQLVKYMNSPGLPRRDQHRAGRNELLATSFDRFERETRSQLARILGPGGFDPARDIAAITVNRWPHGYAYTYNSLYDPVEWVYSQSPERPCVVGRQPFGLVSIANSDAAASPHTDAAIQEAHRAVAERIERRTFPLDS